MDVMKKINAKWILIPKILYFLLCLYFYTLHQFRTPFILHTYNVNKQAFGKWISIAQLLSFISNVAIGRLNDKSGKQRLILLSLISGSIFTCHLFFYTKNAYVFWALYFVYFSILSVTSPLLDKFVLDYINKSPNINVESYGTQRIWSTIGYLFCNFILETIIINTDEKKDFSGIMSYNLITGIATLVAFGLFVQNIAPRRVRASGNSAIKRLLKNYEFMYFMLIILLSGIVRASMTLYLSDYMTDVLNFKKTSKEPSYIAKLGFLQHPVRFFMKTKMSITSLFGVLLEIVVFFNSKRIIRRFGLYMPMFVACVSQLFRFIGYYFLHYKNKNAFYISCGLELLKGLTFGLMQTSVTLIVGSMTPESIRTTALIVYNGTYIALGTILSGIIFSFVFDKSIKKPGFKSYQEYINVYIVNIIISVAIIVLFLVKYAIKENLLFNRANADARIEELRKKSELDEQKYIENDSNLKDNATLKI